MSSASRPNGAGGAEWCAAGSVRHEIGDRHRRQQHHADHRHDRRRAAAREATSSRGSTTIISASGSRNSTGCSQRSLTSVARVASTRDKHQAERDEEGAEDEGPALRQARPYRHGAASRPRRQEGGGGEHGQRQPDIAGDADDHRERGSAHRAKTRPESIVDLELRGSRQGLGNGASTPSRGAARRGRARARSPPPSARRGPGARSCGDAGAGHQQRRRRRGCSCTSPAPRGRSRRRGRGSRPSFRSRATRSMASSVARGEGERQQRVGVGMERLPADLRDGEQPQCHHRGLERVGEDDAAPTGIPRYRPPRAGRSGGRRSPAGRSRTARRRRAGASCRAAAASRSRQARSWVIDHHLGIVEAERRRRRGGAAAPGGAK